MASSKPILLPTSVVSPGDVKRLRREIETIEDFLHQAGLRVGGTAVKLPPASRVLQDMAEGAELNLLQAVDRRQLSSYMSSLLDTAPLLHMSFASTPSPAFLGKLLTWLRANIHPQVLVTVGVQPSIAAGCIVRTANKQFDLSLRQSFNDQKVTLIDSLRQTGPAAAQTTTETTVKAAA